MAYGSTKSISDSILSATDGESIQEQIDVYMQSTASGTTGDGLIAAATINKDTDAAVTAMRMKSLGARKSQATAQNAVTKDKLASVGRDWTALLMGIEEEDATINATLRSDMMAKKASSTPQTANEAYLQRRELPTDGDRPDVLTPDGSDNISGSGASEAEGRFGDTGASGMMSSLRPKARGLTTTPSTTSLMSRPTADNVDAIDAYRSEFSPEQAQKSLGFIGREVDGIFGRGSNGALNDFQKQIGVPVTDFSNILPSTVEALKNIETATQEFLDRIAYGEGAKAGDETDYEIVYGYDLYAKPEIDGISTGLSGPPNAPVKITEMTFAQLYDYQNKLITATTGKIPAGKDKKGKQLFLKDKNGNYVGTSALGKYQVVRDSLFGKNGTPEKPKAKSWAAKLNLDENTIFTPEIQERIGRLALKEAGFDNWLYNRYGGKSEKDMMEDVSSIWASVEGNSYGQGTHTYKKDLEKYLNVLRKRGVSK